MNDFENILKSCAFGTLASAGHHLALRVGFAFPEFEENSLPEDWIKFYTKNGLMIFDPITRWIYDNQGFARWSEISTRDERNILASAATFGLRFGAAVSITDSQNPGLRSYGSFARSDREFDTSELQALEESVARLHNAIEPARTLTKAELEALRMLAAGHILKEIAYQLGISESAVKLRLANVRGKLGSRTNTQSVGQAKQFGWI